MTNTKKNVIIVSARRSGTHLLVDLIVNNFGYKSINYNYIDYKKYTGKPKYPTSELDKLVNAFNKGNRVTWTHAHDFLDYRKRNHTEEDNVRLDNLFKNSKIILIYRDVRDIIDSCYHRPRYKSKYKTFDNFYKNFDFDGYELIDQSYPDLSSLLTEYYKNWFSVYMSKEVIGLDMEIISYEEIINRYEDSVEKIAEHLDLNIDKVVDIRLPESKNKNAVYTTNDFRSGSIGNWIDTIHVDLGKKIKTKYDIDIGIGLMYFLNDSKVHKHHVPKRDEFTLSSKDWSKINMQLDKVLSGYESRFKYFGKRDIEQLIKNRYTQSIQRSTDFRYFHKVFYYTNYVLKFIYPCKATLEKKVFDTVIPIASKEILNTVLNTNDKLYESGVIPKLYYAGIYKGVLFVVQEKCPKENVICEKYNLYPQADDWSWVVTVDGLFQNLLELFFAALSNNIVLTDLVNVYNCAYDKNGKLKYFDLDGIKDYKYREEMLDSLAFKNTFNILKEVDKHYVEKHKHSLLKGFNRYL